MKVNVNQKGQVVNEDGSPMYQLIERSHKQDAFVYEPTFGGAMLKRVGFLSPIPERHKGNPEYVHDSRPIAWPILHPYWIVRMSADANMLMAYVESVEDLLVYWPEAIEITVFEENVDRYRFNANFPKPPFLDEVHHPEFKVAPHRIGCFRIHWPEDDTTPSIIGFGEDVDYAVQLNNHKLEYGKHENAEFQQMYDELENGWRDLEIQFYPAKDLEAARNYAKQLEKFHNEGEGEIPTTLHF